MTFYIIVGNLLSDSKVIDALLGDFNNDILNSTNINLQNFLSTYTLPVNEATQRSSSSTDHVYFNTESLPKLSVDKTKIVDSLFLILMQ